MDNRISSIKVACVKTGIQYVIMPRSTIFFYIKVVCE